MWRSMLVVLLLLLVGCLEPRPGGTWPVERPEGWDATPKMTVVSGMRAHSADQRLGAAGPAGVPLPAGCAAYQDGVRQGWDTCQVFDQPPRDHQDSPGVTWGLEAYWHGRGEDLIEQERDESRRTVVAFDAAGRPVAHLPRAVAMAIE